MDVIFADHAFEYLDIFGVTDLDDQFTTSGLYVTFEYVIRYLVTQTSCAVKRLTEWLPYLFSGMLPHF